MLPKKNFVRLLPVCMAFVICVMLPLALFLENTPSEKKKARHKPATPPRPERTKTHQPTHRTELRKLASRLQPEDDKESETLNGDEMHNEQIKELLGQKRQKQENRDTKTDDENDVEPAHHELTT